MSAPKLRRLTHLRLRRSPNAQLTTRHEKYGYNKEALPADLLILTLSLPLPLQAMRRMTTNPTLSFSDNYPTIAK